MKRVLKMSEQPNISQYHDLFMRSSKYRACYEEKLAQELLVITPEGLLTLWDKLPAQRRTKILKPTGEKPTHYDLIVNHIREDRATYVKDYPRQMWAIFTPEQRHEYFWRVLESLKAKDEWLLVLLPWLLTQEDRRYGLRAIIEQLTGEKDDSKLVINKLLASFFITSIEAHQIHTLMVHARQMNVESIGEGLLRVMREIQDENAQLRFTKDQNLTTDNLNEQLALIDDLSLGFNIIFRFTSGLFNRYRYFDLFYTLNKLREKSEEAVKHYQENWFDQLLSRNKREDPVLQGDLLTEDAYDQVLDFSYEVYQNESYMQYQPLVKKLFTATDLKITDKTGCTIAADKQAKGILLLAKEDASTLINQLPAFIKDKDSYSYFLYDLLYWIKENYVDEELFHSLKSVFEPLRYNPDFSERVKLVFGSEPLNSEES
jgi:hypothetical protein